MKARRLGREYASGAAARADWPDRHQNHAALIPNVLQEPLGWNLPPLLLLHGLLIHPAADRRKLQALIADIAIEGHLIAAGAPLALAGDEIGELGLVSAPAAVREFRAVPAKSQVWIFRRQPLHLLDR